METAYGANTTHVWHLTHVRMFLLSFLVQSSYPKALARLTIEPQSKNGSWFYVIHLSAFIRHQTHCNAQKLHIFSSLTVHRRAQCARRKRYLTKDLPDAGAGVTARHESCRACIVSRRRGGCKQ
jgi:hypothetical protein